MEATKSGQTEAYSTDELLFYTNMRTKVVFNSIALQIHENDI